MTYRTEHLEPTGIRLQRWGSGPSVLLVHGGIRNGEMTWEQQRPLAERWELLVVDRRGYVPNPPIDREDFEVDAGDIVGILDDGVHLVGHSYGGVIALLAAARRPEAVRSLTVIEPPAFDVARGDPHVEDIIAALTRLQADGPEDPEGILREFVGDAGSNLTIPSPLPPALRQHALLLKTCRPPWEARIPLDVLRGAAFPKLVVSGGHSPAFDKVCDVLEQQLDAERAVILGAGHSVPQTGDPFNDRLEQHLRSASRT